MSKWRNQTISSDVQVSLSDLKRYLFISCSLYTTTDWFKSGIWRIKLVKFKTFPRIFGMSFNLISSRTEEPLLLTLRNIWHWKMFKLNNFIRMMPNSRVESTTFLDFGKYWIEEFSIKVQKQFHHSNLRNRWQIFANLYSATTLLNMKLS